MVFGRAEFSRLLPVNLAMGIVTNCAEKRYQVLLAVFSLVPHHASQKGGMGNIPGGTLSLCASAHRCGEGCAFTSRAGFCRGDATLKTRPPTGKHAARKRNGVLRAPTDELWLAM